MLQKNYLESKFTKWLKSKYIQHEKTKPEPLLCAQYIFKYISSLKKEWHKLSCIFV